MIARTLVDRGQVLSIDPQQVRLSSGIKSPIYCDIKSLQADKSMRDFVVGYLIERIKCYEEKPEIIAGVVSGAIPFSSIVADRLELPHISVRQRNKLYGKEIHVDGKFEEGKKVLLLEDVVITGQSSINGIKAIRAEGGDIDTCLTVVSYNTSKADTAFREIGCNLDYLATIEELIYEHLRTHQPAKKAMSRLKGFVKKYMPHGETVVGIIDHLIEKKDHFLG